MSNDLELTDLHKLMLRNAEEIERLRDRIDVTVRERDKSPEKYQEWKNACAEFHARGNELSFPGGWQTVERIVTGDSFAMEAGISFVECRPYFFRSGYMFQTILKKLKKAPLSEQQKIRLQRVIDKRDSWRRNLPNFLLEKAKQGDRESQRKLGQLYLSDYKYNQDFKFNKPEALKWFRAAAEQGDAEAQRELASNYFYGYGVPQDWEKAYFWQSLAVKHQNGFVEKKVYADDRRRFADKLTPEQKAAIDKLVEEWKPAIMSSQK